MAADTNNPGQFGNRQDTQAQASKGGSMSGGNFKNDPNRASRAGKQGAAVQPTDAKAEGGRQSHRNQ